MQAKNKPKWFVNQLLDVVQEIGYKKLKIRHVHYLILIFLGHFSDKSGYSYPSQKQLSHATGISYTNINKYIKFLEDKKYISTKTKYSRRYKMNRKHYTIHLEVILNLGIDEKGDINVDKIETNTCSSKNEQLVSPTSQGIDQLVSPTSPTIELTTQLKDTNYPTKDIVQKLAEKIQNLNSLPNSKISELPISLFDRFWAAYPRKENKLRALTIWQRKKLDEKGELIIQDILNRIEKHMHWRDKQFIPHASSYLNGERWNDEITEDNYEQAQTGCISHRRSKTEESVKRAFDDYERAERKRGGIS